MLPSRLVPFLLPSCLVLAPAVAAQRRVPSQYATIGAALSAAQQGETILVAAGTYQESLVWPATQMLRLVAEEGPGKTTIDANKTGTAPLTMSRSVTRATLVEGFTITGGLLSGQRNHGAAIHLSGGASPTIHGCVITGNESNGTYWNYGGIYIDGSGTNPRLELCRIEKNTLKAGSWNYGAGVYVSSGAAPEIVGNVITGNTCTVSGATGDRAYGVGVYVSGTGATLVASNLITDNVASCQYWNYGGGVYVASGGAAQIWHNTIANNKCVGGNWRYGGGVNIEGQATVTLNGNVIVRNDASTGGGINVQSGATVVADWNDVWSNTAVDRAGISAGPNDLAVDPMFTSSTDYHLQSASPLVERAPWSLVPASIAVDLDGDPRHTDTDLDGLRGNGARVDVGADEVTTSRLSVTGTPKLGNTLTFAIAGKAPGFHAFLFDLVTGSILVPPFGNLLLSPNVLVIGGGSLPGQQSWTIPNIAGLAGITTHHQALVLPMPRNDNGNLTNRVSLTIY